VSDLRTLLTSLALLGFQANRAGGMISGRFEFSEANTLVLVYVPDDRGRLYLSLTITPSALDWVASTTTQFPVTWVTPQDFPAVAAWLLSGLPRDE